LICGGADYSSITRPSSNLICEKMPWTRKLSSPIDLKDGRILVALADARDVMQTLPRFHQRREHWLYAGALIHEAANGGAMGETGEHLTRALKLEGFI
jgi:hypothetical protein